MLKKVLKKYPNIIGYKKSTDLHDCHGGLKKKIKVSFRLLFESP